MSDQGGIATGVVLAIFGVFLVLRTVVKPSGGRNLVDIVLGLGDSSGSANKNVPSTGIAGINPNTGEATLPGPKGSQGIAVTTPNHPGEPSFGIDIRGVHLFGQTIPFLPYGAPDQPQPQPPFINTIAHGVNHIPIIAPIHL